MEARPGEPEEPQEPWDQGDVLRKSPGLHWAGPAHPTPLALVASTSFNPVGKMLAWALLAVPQSVSSQPSCLAAGGLPTPMLRFLPFQFLPWAVSVPSAFFVYTGAQFLSQAHFPS